MKYLKSFLIITIAFLAGSLISLGTTLVLAHGGDTDLVHACVRNNTLFPNAANIRIVGENDTCNSNETALDWPKTAGSGGSSLTVVDSQNQEVGLVLDDMRAVRQFGNYWVSMDLTSDGFRTVNSFFVVYESSDCSGTPYLSVSGLVKNGIIVGDTIYYPGDPQIDQYSSSREFTPPDTFGECTDQGLVDNINGPLQSSSLPSLTPPFSIQE